MLVTKTSSVNGLDLTINYNWNARLRSAELTDYAMVYKGHNVLPFLSANERMLVEALIEDVLRSANGLEASA